MRAAQARPLESWRAAVGVAGNREHVREGRVASAAKVGPAPERERGAMAQSSAMKAAKTMPAALACVNSCAVLAAFGVISSAWAEEAAEDALEGETAASEEVSAELSVSVHQQDIGWTEGVSSGATAGTTGEDLRVEAIALTLRADVEGSSSDDSSSESSGLSFDTSASADNSSDTQLRRFQLRRLREHEPDRGQLHQRKRSRLPLSRGGDCTSSRGVRRNRSPFLCRLCGRREFLRPRLACSQVVYTSPVHATTKTAFGSAAAFRDEPHGLKGFGRTARRFPSEQRG